MYQWADFLENMRRFYDEDPIWFYPGQYFRVMVASLPYFSAVYWLSETGARQLA